MIACGGGKNGNGSQANFAVATSHSVRSSPSTSNHGARWRSAVPALPRKSALKVPKKASAAMTNAPIPSEWVRDQSPRSSHNRHDRPNATQAMAAAIPGPACRSRSRRSRLRDPDRAASVAIPSDSEYVDINPLREFGGIRARLENGDRLQIVRIGLQLPLEHVAHGMMMIRVIADHALEIGERRRLRRIGLERFRRLVGI